jgi:hypothetical protein
MGSATVKSGSPPGPTLSQELIPTGCDSYPRMNGANYPIDTFLILASPPEKSETLYNQINPDGRFEE